MIFRAFLSALGQMPDRRFRRVLGMGLLLTLALLIGVSAGVVWLIGYLAGEDAIIPLIGEVRWLNDLASWGSLLAMIVLSVFLMIPVASAITSMFLDDVARAVEDKHYPHIPTPGKVPLWEALRDTINFLGVLIGLNILALFVYVIPFFTPFAPLIFFALNGWLLGREYFTLAAMRHVGRKGARHLRREYRSTIWLAGTLMAIPLTIPVMNLFIPILGAATFTHLFHRLTAQGSRGG